MKTLCNNNEKKNNRLDYYLLIFVSLEFVLKYVYVIFEIKLFFLDIYNIIGHIDWFFNNDCSLLNGLIAPLE